MNEREEAELINDAFDMGWNARDPEVEELKAMYRWLSARAARHESDYYDVLEGMNPSPRLREAIQEARKQTRGDA